MKDEAALIDKLVELTKRGEIKWCGRFTALCAELPGTNHHIAVFSFGTLHVNGSELRSSGIELWRAAKKWRAAQDDENRVVAVAAVLASLGVSNG